MTPIKLSDADLAAVLQAARPLARHQRDAFLQAVAAELSRLRGTNNSGTLGPGSVHRVCREVLKRFFDPPLLG
jgi:hypothetical protein